MRAGLAELSRLCYHSVPRENDCRFKQLRQFDRVVSERHDAKKEVDEHRETLHNLASLLLTNKTIRRTQQGSTEHSSLTINSR
jgi:hypothetical protein